VFVDGSLYEPDEKPEAKKENASSREHSGSMIRLASQVRSRER
jgi:hypothetical protein